MEQKTKKEKKYLYCPKCKNYPDNIVEKEAAITRRFWDGECYQGKDTEFTGDNTYSFCEKCDTELIDKNID